MAVALTTVTSGDRQVEQAAFPPELERALELVPDANLAEPTTMPPNALAWQGDEAACLTQCVESFFGSVEMGGADPGVRSICGACPLQAACITHALANEAWGVWGLTERERASLGGVARRSKTNRGSGSPREAAASAVAAGIDPYALAEALCAVHAVAATAVDPEPTETLPAPVAATWTLPEAS